MSETQYISVRNWDRFQHYRKRNPPWIKLHTEILQNYHFTKLAESSRCHLLAIFVLAARCDNQIPADAGWIAQQISAQTPIDFKALSHFLVGCEHLASNALASAVAKTELEVEGDSLPGGEPDSVPSWFLRDQPPPMDEEPEYPRLVRFTDSNGNGLA